MGKPPFRTPGSAVNAGISWRAEERAKASIRAAVEHPFRVLKRQFGDVKVRDTGLAKNASQVTTLFALVDLWMARRRLLAMA